MFLQYTNHRRDARGSIRFIYPRSFQIQQKFPLRTFAFKIIDGYSANFTTTLI